MFGEGFSLNDGSCWHTHCIVVDQGDTLFSQERVNRRRNERTPGDEPLGPKKKKATRCRHSTHTLAVGCCSHTTSRAPPVLKSLTPTLTLSIYEEGNNRHPIIIYFYHVVARPQPSLAVTARRYHAVKTAKLPRVWQAAT